METLSYFLDFVLHIDVHLFELVEQYGLWIYAILFVIVFCETGLVVTPFLPGDSLLFASGVVAGAGLMGYPEVMLVLLAAGISGDAVNYCIGPLGAGNALMNPAVFFFYNIIGCLLWVGALVSAGFFLGNLTWVRENFSLIVYAIILLSVMPVCIEFLRAWLGRGKDASSPREKNDGRA